MNTNLQPQLKNSTEIKNILKEVSTSFTLDDGKDVSTLLVYLPCQESGRTSLESFFECIKNGILQNFVFSCKEIEKKLGLDSDATTKLLFDRALRKISRHTAKGELGELILFTLLDVYIEAPKLLSKVSLKTSPRMPVFGADGIHGKFVNGEFRVYLGESKLHKTFKSAAIDAAKSMYNAKEKFDDEFELLESYMDFPNLEPEIESKILEVLNPYKSEDYLSNIHSPCFIGFSQPDILFEDESKYIESYKELSKEYVKDFFSKVSLNNLDTKEVSLLMLPFGCVDELEEEFISYMGIYK